MLSRTPPRDDPDPAPDPPGLRRPHPDLADPPSRAGLGLAEARLPEPLLAPIQPAQPSPCLGDHPGQGRGGDPRRLPDHRPGSVLPEPRDPGRRRPEHRPDPRDRPGPCRGRPAGPPDLDRGPPPRLDRQDPRPPRRRQGGPRRVVLVRRLRHPPRARQPGDRPRIRPDPRSVARQPPPRDALRELLGVRRATAPRGRPDPVLPAVLGQRPEEEARLRQRPIYLDPPGCL